MKIILGKIMISSFLILIQCSGMFSIYAQTTTEEFSSVIDVNYSELISRADLHYTEPVERSEAGMPVGNGRMGSLVWTTQDMLKFQFNRVDLFANTSATNNFFQRNTSYNSGLGFVSIDFADFDSEMFTGDQFEQYLSVYDGEISVKGQGIEANITAWDQEDVMAVQIQDQRKDPAPIRINLRMLRPPTVNRGNHTAVSEVKEEDGKIMLTQKFTEDEFYSASAVVIDVSGRKTKARITNESEVQLTAAPGSGAFSIFMGSSASFAQNEDLIERTTRKVDEAKSERFADVANSTREWWHNFWEKGFVYLHSDDGKAESIEKHYTYYLYVMASSSRGAYPPKFNGMLWTTGGDARQWGSAYWGANQSCLYNALFPTNRIELMDPMFNHYNKARSSFEVAARQQWESRGLYIPETMTYNGLPEMPSKIAAEMQDLYLLRKPWDERSEEFEQYASTKMPFLSRWNWKTDQGWGNGKWHYDNKSAGPFGHVTHIFSRGAKIAYQHWLKYEYLQDEEWLKNSAYPFVKGVAEFYRNFPNLKQEEDGRYHIYHVNDNESIWGARNTIEEISSMKGILPVAIKASRILDVDVDLRKKWQELFDNLSPLPQSSARQANGDNNLKNFWIRGLPPVIDGNTNRVPDPNTMPVWFFDLVTLESDSKVLDVANATYDRYFSEGIDENTAVNVLSKLPVTGALLGRQDVTRNLIYNQIHTSEVDVMPNRMDLREGYQTTSIQRIGRAADALHSALLQNIPPEPAEMPSLHVFPAWPRDWDAKFSLLARGNFLVSASINDGKIEFVEVISRSGTELQMRNPWPDRKVTVFKNGNEWREMQSDIFTIPTVKGDNFIFAINGKTSKQLQQNLFH